MYNFGQNVWNSRVFLLLKWWKSLNLRTFEILSQSNNWSNVNCCRKRSKFHVKSLEIAVCWLSLVLLGRLESRYSLKSGFYCQSFLCQFFGRICDIVWTVNETFDLTLICWWNRITSNFPRNSNFDESQRIRRNTGNFVIYEIKDSGICIEWKHVLGKKYVISQD